MVKQVIVVRTDLNMRKGKMGAQVAHASMKVFFDRMSTEVDKLPVFQLTGDMTESTGYVIAPLTTKKIVFYRDDPMLLWMEGSFTKIVVGCNSEQELFDLQKQAEEAGIVNALILDNGNTEFKEICNNCQGTGIYKHPILSSVYKGIKGAEECLDCKGTGKINKLTYTCLAIGPDESEKIDKVTGQLKLL